MSYGENGAEILGLCGGFTVLGADSVEPSLDGVVKAVVEALRFDGFQPRHPVVFPLLEKSPVFHLGVVPVVPDLLDKREAGVFVKVVPR